MTYTSTSSHRNYFQRQEHPVQGHTAPDLCLYSSQGISCTLRDVLMSQADLVPCLG